MTVIIAEKPSLGRNIAGALGDGFKKGDGCLIGQHYIVTWGFGHLFELCDIEHYQGIDTAGKKAKWTMEGLPCFPKKYRFELRRDSGKIDAGVKKQFETVRSLLLRSDVDTVVNAGDADREGEIIVRIIIDQALRDTEKYTAIGKYRLWLPDQTNETIRRAIGEMKEESDYDLLAYEGYARTFIDWLYGVNLTRYATLKTGTLLRVGRVIVPIVKAIYDRDMAIKNFVPETYYVPLTKEKTNGEEVELQSKQRFSAAEKRELEALCARYQAAKATVTAVKKKKDTLNPGKLYSLSKLQNVLGKKFKMSMADSLAVVQKLYEMGYVTYPRTNSEYLATAEKDKVKAILGKVKEVGYPVAFRDSKTIFDDSKIESHSALTPTTKIPDKSRLTPDEAKVYGTILRRFVAVFCAEPCVCEKSEIKIDILEDGTPEALESFILKGTVILEPGWTKYDDSTQKDRILPKLSKGDIVVTDWKPAEKETNPPKHYTIETLNQYLKNPFKEELSQKKTEAAKADADPDAPEQDEEDYRAIFEGLELGTEATRTGIIDNARKSGYIQLKKDVYTILPDGCYLIESLSRMKIGMDKYKTAELGKALKKVFHGEISINASLRLAEREIAEVFAQNVTAVPQKTDESYLATDTDDGFFGDEAGKCPLCGKSVIKGKFGYYCKGYKEGCTLKISGVICDRVISKRNVSLLLTEGRTALIRGFRSKKGKLFDARLKLEDGKAVFEFEPRPQELPQEAAPSDAPLPDAPEEAMPVGSPTDAPPTA